MKTPILAIFDLEALIVFKTDISDYALEACLIQTGQDKKPHPVAFYFRKMSPAELNYDIHNKKLLIIVAAVGVRPLPGT